MDTRLTELLPMALDLRNGDAKIIKVAGAMVAHPFGSVMRSILVAVYGLGAEHILVVGHHDCGMTGMDPSRLLSQAKQRGIPDATFKTLKASGLDLDSWLSGFDNVRSSVLHSVDTIKNHPLLNFEETSVLAAQQIAPATLGGCAATTQPPPVSVQKTIIPKITVTGFVICPTTGKLDIVTPMDEQTQALINEHLRIEAETDK
jgi:carbonic anhydrase